LGTAATTGLLYQPRMIGDGDCGEIGEMKIGRGNRNNRRKPLCFLKFGTGTRIAVKYFGVRNFQFHSYLFLMSNGSYKYEARKSLYSGQVNVVSTWPPARQPCEIMSL
jgi:hypothetical protein